MRIGLKPFNERGKQEKDFINDYLFHPGNKRNLIETTQKMLNLYALIEEKTKSNSYGRNNRKAVFS
jgi:hypothetical protein